MRRLALALLILFLLVITAPLSAQITFRYPPPDCHLARYAMDQPFSENASWTMRRYQWHGFYAGLSVASAEGLHRLTKLPRWSTALIASVGIGFVPHIRAVIRESAGQRTINPRDWAFDGLVRSAPLFLVASGDSWRSRSLAASTFVGGYLALACFASP